MITPTQLLSLLRRWIRRQRAYEWFERQADQAVESLMLAIGFTLITAGILISLCTYFGRKI